MWDVKWSVHYDTEQVVLTVCTVLYTVLYWPELVINEYMRDCSTITYTGKEGCQLFFLLNLSYMTVFVKLKIVTGAQFLLSSSVSANVTLHYVKDKFVEPSFIDWFLKLAWILKSKHQTIYIVNLIQILLPNLN